MSGSASLRTWSAVHKGSSLVCTLFILLLCVTGLPLIFQHEIGHLLGTEVQAPTLPANAPRASLDRVVAVAQARHPGKVPQFVSTDLDDERLWFVTFGDTPRDDAASRTVVVDARTAQVLAEPRFDQGFMHVMLTLHTDLFAGLPGTLLLGVMGLLLVTAIVSGVVLYAPFMRKLPFGALRRGHAPRTRWLDLHNLLGIVTLVWAGVVGVTGVINTLAEPLVALWRIDQLAAMIGPDDGAPVSRPLASLQASVDAAQVLEPGTEYTSSRHYGIFLRGATPLTARLLAPVLVDAQSGVPSANRALPWYITALLVSQPLHFGDYGGLPLKLLWALLDIATIVVLVSGLVLWRRRRERPVAGAALPDVGAAPAHAAPATARARRIL